MSIPSHHYSSAAIYDTLAQIWLDYLPWLVKQQRNVKEWTPVNMNTIMTKLSKQHTYVVFVPDPASKLFFFIMKPCFIILSSHGKSSFSFLPLS